MGQRASKPSGRFPGSQERGLSPCYEGSSGSETLSHKRATKRYRNSYCFAGTLVCQLLATPPNFFVVGRSALGILLGDCSESAEGEDATLRGRSLLDGSMPLTRVQAADKSTLCWRPPHPGARPLPTPCSPAFGPLSVRAPLLGCRRSAICCTVSTSGSSAPIDDLAGLLRLSRVNLGRGAALAC